MRSNKQKSPILKGFVLGFNFNFAFTFLANLFNLIPSKNIVNIFEPFYTILMTFRILNFCHFSRSLLL